MDKIKKNIYIGVGVSKEWRCLIIILIIKNEMGSEIKILNIFLIILYLKPRFISSNPLNTTLTCTEG